MKWFLKEVSEDWQPAEQANTKKIFFSSSKNTHIIIIFVCGSLQKKKKYLSMENLHGAIVFCSQKKGCEKNSIIKLSVATSVTHQAVALFLFLIVQACENTRMYLWNISYKRKLFF